MVLHAGERSGSLWRRVRAFAGAGRIEWRWETAGQLKEGFNVAWLTVCSDDCALLSFPVFCCKMNVSKMFTVL